MLASNKRSPITCVPGVEVLSVKTQESCLDSRVTKQVKRSHCIVDSPWR